MKILDCTLRDGGYYNQWSFSISEVNSYLTAAANANIDYVEVGFRFTPKKEFLGPFAYSSDEFLNSLNLPSKLKLGVMVNLKDIINESDPLSTLKKLFKPRISSPVELVRIACHFNDALESKMTIDFLSELGYTIGLNIMQVSSCPKEKLEKIAREVQSWGNISVLYFADSLGDMHHKEIKQVYNILKENWQGEIGIHTHNNMGQALSNSIWSMENGITWIDGTMTGMGRGAGNAELELLLIEANKYDAKYDSSSLIESLYAYFYPMKQRYNWGTNFFYYLSANKKIHPTYVQQMLSESIYQPDEILNALSYISNNNTTSYNTESLGIAIKNNFNNCEGSPVDDQSFEGKAVLIIASPNDSTEFDPYIESYIHKNSPIVICLNSNKSLNMDCIDYFACCHPTRIACLIGDFEDTSRPVISPKFRPEDIFYSKVKHINFGLKIDNENNITNTGCSLEEPLVGAYAIAYAIACGAKTILTIGYRGYSADDSRHISMNNFVDHIQDSFTDVTITSLTPSTYNFNQSSIFSPWTKE